MMNLDRRTVLALAAAAAIAVPAAVSASPVSDFYKGRTVTIYVGYGAGGGYDTNARMLARHIVDHIPGHPDAIVKNMPGAGSKTVLNFLYNVAPKDGTVMAIFSSQAAMEPILLGDQSKGTQYDPQKYSWIGSIDQFTPIGIAWHTSGVTSIKDVEHKALKVGTAGGGSMDSVYARLLNGMIGTKFVFVSGYRGSKDITHAMEQGEVPAMVGWYWAGLKRSKPQWLKDHLVNVFMQFGIDKNPDIPSKVQWVFDALKKPADKQTFRLVLSNLTMARPFAAPPGVPADRVDALRSAFNATMSDKGFEADMTKVGLHIKPYQGKKIDALLKEVAATPKPLVERVQKAFAAAGG